MKFSFGKDILLDDKQIINKNFLLTNKQGSYTNISIAGFPLYNDAGLMTIALNSPVERFHVLSHCYEIIEIDYHDYMLSTTYHVDDSKNCSGNQYLIKFEYEYTPKWIYLIDGIILEKSMVLSETDNTIAFKYRILQNSANKAIRLKIIPGWRLVKAGNNAKSDQSFISNQDEISSNQVKVYINSTDAFTTKAIDYYYVDDLICFGDKGNGRNSIESYRLISEYIFNIQETINFNFSINKRDQRSYDDIKQENQHFIDQRLAKINNGDPLVKQLAYEANKFIVHRQSVNADTIIAGFPFFADWGRDTMIAILGLAIATDDITTCISILDTFVKYEKNGLLVNVFSLDGEDNMYNSVDAPLWFINAVYQLFNKIKDVQIYQRYFSCIQTIIEHYIQGTLFHIKVDLADGLVMAGDLDEQVTWMDVKVNGILPTPRHGKPIEINALWYNALNIYQDICEKLQKDNPYQVLIDQVKVSMQKYWMADKGCLKDNLSLNDDWHDYQIRCNQIWAISLPFIAFDQKQCQAIFDVVHQELYTGYGLRSLSNKDPEFKCIYQGNNVQRDLAYHQGTVWVFPLGAYFEAYLKLHNYNETSKQIVNYQIDILADALKEGCLGQLPEIYDGANPRLSKGCFAQAWSMGEILRIAMEVK